MFVTTTLGGLALAISISVTAGALIRPRIDLVRDRIVDSAQQTLRRYRRTAEVKSPGSSGGA